MPASTLEHVIGHAGRCYVQALEPDGVHRHSLRRCRTWWHGLLPRARWAIGGAIIAAGERLRGGRG